MNIFENKDNLNYEDCLKNEDKIKNELQHMQFATRAICNTSNLQHVQFATHPIRPNCNTSNLKQGKLATCATLIMQARKPSSPLWK